MREGDAKVNRRVLVIDDNPAIHEDFKKILSASHENELDEEEVLALPAS